MKKKVAKKAIVKDKPKQEAKKPVPKTQPKQKKVAKKPAPVKRASKSTHPRMPILQKKKRSPMSRTDRDKRRDEHDDAKHPAALIVHHQNKQVPPPAPEPAPKTYSQIAQRVDLKLKGVKRDGEHIDNQGVKNVLDGSDPLNAGDVVNFDGSPFDQNNAEIGPFGDTPYTDLDQFLIDPALGTYTSADPEAKTTTGAVWPEGQTNHRTQYRLSKDGSANVSITGEYRDYGLPVNVKVEPDSGEGSFTLQEVSTLADGRVLESNVVGPLRVKPWQT